MGQDDARGRGGVAVPVEAPRAAPAASPDAAPSAQRRAGRPAWRLTQAFRHPHYFKTLEIAINDFCNLTCKLCSQGTPYQQDKRVMRLEELWRLSQFFRPYEFRAIKISGGEPTIHPDFAALCRELPRMFPAKRYVLATNGALLEKHREALRVFAVVELSHYPGQNDETYERLVRGTLPRNVLAMSKSDYAQMIDVFQERNRGKIGVFEHCGWPRQMLKLVQGRIYPCCIAFGLTNLRSHVPVEDVGVPVDAHWRERLAALDIERHCKTCWVDVAVPRTRAQRWRRDGMRLLRRAKMLATDCVR